MAKVLIVRLSAIGDVAMTIPVVYSVAKMNPTDSFTLLTQSFLIPLFINKPDNLELIGINTKKEEKTTRGFLRFSNQLLKNRYDACIDLHNVLRSQLLGFLFQLKGKPIYKLDKKRKERKRLIQKPPKTIQQLPLMTNRYGDVLHAAGFKFENTFISLFAEKPIDKEALERTFGEKQGIWIGIAPFAKHKGKMYPTHQMEKVVTALSQQENTTIFLLGGKGEEEAILNQWGSQYKHTRNIAGRYSFEQELPLISCLDVLISMDSANMHFASLVNTKVISIWGATHPFAGFYGYRQAPELIIQADLPCRPCSVFGDKPCYRGDWACMNKIEPEQIVNKVNDFLNKRLYSHRTTGYENNH